MVCGSPYHKREKDLRIPPSAFGVARIEGVTDTVEVKITGFRLSLGFYLAILLGGSLQALEVGFGEVDITPKLGGREKVWLAGYGTGREAAGVFMGGRLPGAAHHVARKQILDPLSRPSTRCL